MVDPGGALLLQTNLTCIRFEDGNKLLAYASLLPIASILFQLGAAWATRCALRAHWTRQSKQASKRKYAHTNYHDTYCSMYTVTRQGLVRM